MAKECRRCAGDALGNAHDPCGLLGGALEDVFVQVMAADLAGLASGGGSGGGGAQALWLSVTERCGAASLVLRHGKHSSQFDRSVRRFRSALNRADASTWRCRRRTQESGWSGTRWSNASASDGSWSAKHSRTRA